MFDLTRIADIWRRRKKARAELMLESLKARYHTFRALLSNNEFSLDLLKSLEQAFASHQYCKHEFAETVDEILAVTYELVDGLQRLTGEEDGLLYHRHRAIAEAIREELEKFAARSSCTPACIPFDEIRNEIHAEVGGKAASLAILKRAGFAVPDGFVVTISGCGDFLSANGLDGLIRRKLKFASVEKESAELQAACVEVEQEILTAELPAELREAMSRAFAALVPDGTPVSVRSSALVEDRPEHSFAGQFKTVLNVTSFETFLGAFKDVLAGNFSARAAVYRMHAGLPPAGNDMAVICQRMVVPKSAGVLFTLDPTAPDSGRMLISAVPGLGIAAVSGEVPADVYRPLRDGPETEPVQQWARVAEKTTRTVPDPAGGLLQQALPPAEAENPALSESEIRSLVRLGRKIEALAGAPQDIEWAVSETGEFFVLQSRGIRVSIKSRHVADSVRGREILRAGTCASEGRCAGAVKVIRSQQELENWPGPRQLPTILVLRQSMVDAARWLPCVEGAIVEAGNPADHLSCVAREYGRPMLTGAAKATDVLHDGQWIVLDAGRTAVFEAPDNAWPDKAACRPSRPAEKKQHAAPATPGLDAARLRSLIEPLNLTDAYGPTFSIHECKSIHDIIRYTHEMAVLAMFETGDDVLEEAHSLVHRLEGTVPLHVMLIDLGGGLAPQLDGFRIGIDDVLSHPFRALWEGIATPGLRWSSPPPFPGFSGLISRAMLDGRSARPVGGQNYALVTGEYMNLNARVDYHFTMIDTVCGPNPRHNYIRFRFKGGGTAAVQRERRARFIAEILGAYAFAIDRQGDLLTASIAEMHEEDVRTRLEMLGRLMGFTRLLDAAMKDDNMPARAARAFLEGDYSLQGMGV